MPIINQDISAGSVATPAAGNTTLFTDAGLAYIKQSSGTVLPIGGLTPSGVIPGTYANTSVQVDSNGIITWIDNGIPTSPGGFDTNIQFNNSGFFVGNNGFTYNTLAGWPTVCIGTDTYDTGGTIRIGPLLAFDNSSITATNSAFNISQAFGTPLTLGSSYLGAPGILIGQTSSYNDVEIRGPLNISGTIESAGNSGIAYLSSGSVYVTCYNLRSTSKIFVTVQTLGTVTVPQAMYISAFNPYSDFTITSADATDTSTVAWFVIN